MFGATDDDVATVTLMKRLPSLKGVLDFLMEEGSLREVLFAPPKRPIPYALAGPRTSLPKPAACPLL